jgi:hypothetical protein
MTRSFSNRPFKSVNYACRPDREFRNVNNHLNTVLVTAVGDKIDLNRSLQ